MKYAHPIKCETCKVVYKYQKNRYWCYIRKCVRCKIKCYVCISHEKIAICNDCFKNDFLKTLTKI